MKKMVPFACLLLAGLAGCGFWLYRLHAKPAPVKTHVPTRRSPPMDGWQGAIRWDARTDYREPKAVPPRLLEKLRTEEARQQPQERRN